MAGTWTYDPALLATSPPTTTTLMMQVRTLIGDVNSTDQQLWDQQIAFALSEEGNNIYLASAGCCRQLAAKYSRDVDTTQGELHRLYSARQKAYAMRAVELTTKGRSRSPGAGYSGSISIAAKDLTNQDSDRVQPAFLRGLTDNWLPTSPVDNQIGTTDQGNTPTW